MSKEQEKAQPQAFVLRLPQELKEALEKQAKAHDRSLNAEILQRLRRSIEPQRGRHKLEEPAGPDYIAHGETEHAMLQVFRKFTVEKQLALLSLFK